MARITAIGAGLFWLIIGLAAFGVGGVAVVTVWLSRLLGGTFYAEASAWLTRDIFLENYEAAAVDVLLLGIPPLVVIMGLAMLSVAAALLRYGLLTRPASTVGVGVGFSLSVAALLLMVLLYLNTTIPGWVGYARQRLDNAAAIALAEAEAAAQAAAANPSDEAASPPTETPIDATIPAFLNLPLPSTPEARLALYEGPLLGSAQLGLGVGAALMALVAFALMSSTIQPPKPRRKKGGGA